MVVERMKPGEIILCWEAMKGRGRKAATPLEISEMDSECVRSVNGADRLMCLNCTEVH